MNRLNAHLLVLTILISTLPLSAQHGERSLSHSPFLQGLEYRSVGPSRGGRATAIAGIPQQPYSFYMGATGGGVWKTDDAGTTWKNVSDGHIKAGSIGAIAVAPSDPNIVYVGTGSACPRGNISAGIGMYKSTDAGKSWKHIGLPEAGQIAKVEIHPENPDRVYAAVLGQIFGPNKERGVYRSDNGGESWELILHVSDSTGAADLVMNPDNPQELFAAMWRAERKPWTLIDGGREGGIWRSMDGGNNWEKLEGGLPQGLLGKIGLAISPVNSERIWAIIIAAEEEKAGLYRSDDGGDNWKRINRDHKLRQRGWYYSHITAHPQDENTVYVNNVNFYKSIDGGKNFDFQIEVPHGDNHGLWLNPDNPNIMLHCNDGGACVSLNGGKTWSSQLNQPTSEFYRVSLDNRFPYYIYAGQQDNSTIAVPSSNPGGITPTQNWFSIGGGECGDVSVNPRNPDIIWAGSYSGEITILNRTTGQIRQVTAYPHYTEGTPQRDLKYRWQWNFPIVVSEFNPQVVYHAGNYVFKTTDDGQTWQKISPDLTRQLDKYHDIPGGPIQHDATGVEVYSSIFALEESPHLEGELWAGTDDGRLHITRDGGQSWTEITPSNMPFEGTINKIELSIHTPGRALVAVYNYRYNDFKPYLYRTDNYGKSWKLLTSEGNGIPSDHFVRAVAEDPDRKGLLYVGTEFGMYVSFDDGAQWEPLQLNLPHVPITDLEVKNDDLVMSTQGRAFWVLDNLTVLRQMNDEVVKSAKYFFAPADAYRTNVANQLPKLHFYLAEKPKDEETVKLEIIDPSGKTVRTYSSKEKNKLNRINATRGLNSFSWDIRHQGPHLVKNLVTMVIRNPSPGPRAIPGQYTVRLSVGTWTSSRPLTILPDPRWQSITADKYARQLEMALKIRSMITESQQRIENLRALKDQIKNMVDLAGRNDSSEEWGKMGKQVIDQLDSVESMIIQNKAEASQDNINYPRVFSNHIGRLYSVVVNAQDEPTGGAQERFEDLRKEYRTITAAYQKVLSNEVATFNNLLEQREVPRLILPEKF